MAAESHEAWIHNPHIHHLSGKGHINYPDWYVISSISFPIGFLTWFVAHPSLPSSYEKIAFPTQTLYVSKRSPLVQLFPIPSLHPFPTLSHKNPTLSPSPSFKSNCWLSLTVSLPYCLVFLIQPHMTLKKPSNASFFLIRFLDYTDFLSPALCTLFSSNSSCPR